MVSIQERRLFFSIAKGCRTLVNNYHTCENEVTWDSLVKRPQLQVFREMPETVIGGRDRLGIAAKLGHVGFWSVGDFEDVHQSLCQVRTSVRSCQKVESVD